MSQKRIGLEKNRKVLTSIVGSIIVTAIGLTMTGPARAALPPFDVALPPPAIAFDARPALSAPPKDSPETIEVALILCACIEGSMSAGATGAGIGSGLGALIRQRSRRGHRRGHRRRRRWLFGCRNRPRPSPCLRSPGRAFRSGRSHRHLRYPNGHPRSVHDGRSGDPAQVNVTADPSEADRELSRLQYREAGPGWRRFFVNWRE